MRGAWASAVVLLLVATGCAPAFQRRAQNVSVVPARIVALPALTLANELSLNDDVGGGDGSDTGSGGRAMGGRKPRTPVRR